MVTGYKMIIFISCYVAYIERKRKFVCVFVIQYLTATVTQCADGTALCVFGTEYIAICALQFKVTCKTLECFVIMDCCKDVCTAVYGNTNSMFCPSLSILSKQFALQLFEIPNNT